MGEVSLETRRGGKPERMGRGGKWRQFQTHFPDNWLEFQFGSLTSPAEY